MTERYDLRDEHGRTTGYVLREMPHRAPSFRSGPRAPEPDSPIAVAVCFVFGAAVLVATLAFLWAAATAA